MKKLFACSLSISLAIVLLSGCGKPQPAAVGSTDSDDSSQGDLIASIDKHVDEIMASTAKG